MVCVGTVLVRGLIDFPAGARLETEPAFQGWRIVKIGSSADIDCAIASAGWHFFYLAGELHNSAFSPDGGRAIIKALTKIARQIEENLNAMEVTGVRMWRIGAFHRASVKVHARHIKQTPFLVDLGDSRRMEIPDVADEVLTADLHS